MAGGGTQPEGARSGPGDTDLVMYSLRKYLRLATKGNPTARDTVEAHLRSGDTPLRLEADLAAVSAWATSAHRRHWGWG